MVRFKKNNTFCAMNVTNDRMEQVESNALFFNVKVFITHMIKNIAIKKHFQGKYMHVMINFMVNKYSIFTVVNANQY